MAIVEDQSDLIYLFEKYIHDQCTPEELKRLFNLIREQDNELLLNTLIDIELKKDTLTPLHRDKEEQAIRRVKSALLTRVRAETVEHAKLAADVKLMWMGNRWRVAAIWLLLLGATLSVVYLSLRYKQQSSATTSVQELATQAGQRKFIRLFDGTKIWLGPSSTLRFHAGLVNSLRQVTLDGQAFFEVAKDKVHPFIIHTGYVQTEVVGTSFGIHSDSRHDQFSITVVTGKVKVSVLSAKAKKLSEVLLTPKQEASLNPEHSALKMTAVSSVVPALKERDGILSYDGAPVAKVVADLERSYGVPIELSSARVTCLCYGEFNTNKPVQTVLRQLTAAIGAGLDERDGHYIIVGGCNDTLENVR